MTSCAHTFMRGTVAMKINEKVAHVCLGSNDVKVGDQFEFYDNCEFKLIGKGTVTKLKNSHYSEVVTDGSFKLAEGIIVQVR